MFDVTNITVNTGSVYCAVQLLLSHNLASRHSSALGARIARLKLNAFQL
jgi:hypothetical protein